MLSDPALRTASRPVMDLAHKTALLGAVERAFLIMAALLSSLMLFFVLLRSFLIRVAPNHQKVAPAGMFDALRSPWALFGAAAIGLYVGAEVSVGSIMINFLNQGSILSLPFDDAGAYLANFYWGGALLGRLVGTALLTRIRATRLLGLCGMIAVLLCATVLIGHGPIAGYAALSIGFFNSIMFPTIFTITLERSGVSRSSTSGLLCLAIFGGALLPVAVGTIADSFGLSASFIIPLVAYAFITFFAVSARGSNGPAEPAFEAPASASPIP
jgi:FHS family L-fucose permease-like MFS transporter